MAWWSIWSREYCAEPCPPCSRSTGRQWPVTWRTKLPAESVAWRSWSLTLRDEEVQLLWSWHRGHQHAGCFCKSLILLMSAFWPAAGRRVGHSRRPEDFCLSSERSSLKMVAIGIEGIWWARKKVVWLPRVMFGWTFPFLNFWVV